MLDIKILSIDGSLAVNAIGRLGSAQGEATEASATELKVPWHPLLPDQGLFPLLSWHSRVSKFAGREVEMNQLTEWANADQKVWVKFVVGDGGFGKSRLGGEFAESLQKEKWSAGFVDLHRDLDFRMEKAGTLLVIDYPEERTDKVRELLHDLTFCQPPSRLRVLFLTRQSPDKWEPIIAAANAKTIVDRNALTLTRLRTQDAKTIYDSTARKSTDYLQKFSEKGHGAEAIPIGAMEAYLKTADVNERPLFVMAAAVHCAENPDEELVNYSGRDIVKALAEREVDRYRRIASSKGWKDEYALARLLAMAAIADVISPDDIKDILERTDLPLGVTLEDNIQSELTSAGLLIDGMVRAPKPDIVAAAFAVDVLGKRVEIAPELIWEALSGDVEGGMERLGRLCWDAEIVLGIQEPCLSDWLASAVEDDLKRCQQLERIIEDDNPPQGWLKAAVAVWKTLATHAANSETLARYQSMLAIDLRSTGDPAGSLEAIKEAVKAYRPLAEANPTRFESSLAGCLDTLSIGLATTGDNPGALEASKEAIVIYRRLADDDANAIAPHLAATLHNFSGCLSYTDDVAGSLEAGEEAVTILRRLASENPSRHEPGLAKSLDNLSHRKAKSGDAAGALVAAEEAVEIGRRLAVADHARFEPDLADGLGNISTRRLRDAGDAVGALAAAKEALDIYQRLAAATPDRFEPDVARALGAMGRALGTLERGTEAAAAFAEGVRLIRPYADKFPGSPHEQLLKFLQRSLNTNP